MDDLDVRRLKIVLLVSSVLCLLLLLVAAFQENFTAEWRTHQSRYARFLAEAAESGGTAASAYPIELRQVYLEEWGRVDRCVSCHVGMENPACKDQPQPLTAHPGNLLQHHPADTFGCTICHQGQGRATDKDAAHGHVPYWDEPLLAGDLVQATCAKCHRDHDLPQTPRPLARQTLVERTRLRRLPQSG